MSTYAKNISLKFTFVVIPILYAIYYVKNLISEFNMLEFNDIYLQLWERGRSGFFIIIYLICLGLFALSDSYNFRYEKSEQNIILRLGNKKYYIYNVFKIFSKAIMFSLLIHLITILFINIIYSFDYNYYEYLQNIYFSKNVIINITIFCILSILGSGIFCISLYPFIYFINNKYVFRVFPAVWFFCTIIIGFVISGFIQNIFGDSILIKTLSVSIVPTSLIEPGCGWYLYAFEDFIAGFTLYLSIFFIASFIKKKVCEIYNV